jgi:hypothetical protein
LRGRREAALRHNPLGAVAVVLLLGLTGVTVWSGAFGGEAWEELHEVVAWTLLAMVGLHVAAVILMSVIEKQNLIRAMIDGNKPAARHPGAVDARPPSFPALLLAAFMIAGTIVAIRQYDPQAFGRRSAEAFEHRVASGDGSLQPTEEEEGDED